MTWIGDLFNGPWWPFLFILIYPLAAVAAIEGARVLDRRDPFGAAIVRETVYGLLPAGAVWLILTQLAGAPPDNVAVRIAQTAFALIALYITLKVIQALLAWLIGDDRRAPKLLLDTVRIGIALLWGAVVISRIWDINLGSLFAAMGVGSIVLGFALQEFLGNMLSGLGLLSARKFEIGDWITVDGRPQRVVAFDWRSATLIDAGGTTTIVANSTLAKGNVVISARAGQGGTTSLTLTLGVEVSPEEARAAMLEAAEQVPGGPPGTKPKCLVTGIQDQRVSYQVVLPVGDPGATSGPKDEFLSRFWFVAQRRGIPLQSPRDSLFFLPPDTLSLVRDSGAVRRHPEVLRRLVTPGALRRYRRGDQLLLEGQAPPEVAIVAAGSLTVLLPIAGDLVRVETVGAGQLLVLTETLAGTASPVRIVAETNADVVVIPRAEFVAAIGDNPSFARDVNAIAESRRKAIAALRVGAVRAA
ncbi:cyclic nucleotide-binding protein [Roseiarcus fermentans]|uniref:Cyclic nucleotide-binding protein n=1 Tax=Roseiarcus fermentans TaxID=1473586 RepID=A0A366EYK2_9HYPH|nr:mechanosensitive ion channel family protein [Roseiarcus fermentans]RBP07434.1 cyclic nucleotide-binding protein [Roseiarcus fermentans]